MTATVAPSSAACSSSSSLERPVRAFASRTPKWQRYQPRMIAPTKIATSVESNDKELYAYQRQYSHIYSDRLMALKDRCWKQLSKSSIADCENGTDNTVVQVNRILELQEDQPSRIVGTLVKEPANDTAAAAVAVKEDKLWVVSQSICRPSDQLFLEDESGRVILNLENSKDYNHQVYQYCTGVVVGIEGTVDHKGILHVERVVPPAPLPPNESIHSADGVIMEESHPDGLDPHLLFVSSMECGDPQVSSLPREMLTGYLQGQFTDTSSKVARIIVAGSGPGSTTPLEGLKEFDMWAGLQVQGAGIHIPMDIMPSAKDPTTSNWPQRPLHSSLLPHCSKHKNTVTTTPNPYEAVCGNQHVLGTDGLNVRDLQQCILKPPPSSLKEGDDKPLRLTELEALEQTLQWSHLCPTAPDRIGVVPSDDVMVMNKVTPNIYFCGNCEEGFATKLINNNVEKTRLICIPKFNETGEAVLVNLKTLDVELLRFQVKEDFGDNNGDSDTGKKNTAKL